jgi:hypothetical protein
MNLVRALALSALVALPTSAAVAAVGFSMKGTLGDGTTVGVMRPMPNIVRFAVNFEPFPTPTSNDPGCGVRLTPWEARYLGQIYMWASSEWAPQAFEKVVPMDAGGEVRVSRTHTTANMETAFDHGGIGVWEGCISSMDDDDAEMVGGWLLTAANP